MEQGSFFKVDKDSIHSEGQILFRYLPVHLPKDKKNENHSHHWFPVYMVIKPYAIDFYYHGPDNRESKEDKKEHHVHVPILHLPLSLNLSVKDNLTTCLSQAYYDSFELNKEYTFELSKTRQSYWNLDVFAGKKGGIEYECAENNNIIKRKLILDFIFDLEHSRVFEASPHYEEIEVHLRENFFFNAIAAKAAYYYNRQLYLDNWRDDDISELYAKNLIDIEWQWLNIIRDSKATDTFLHERWFDLVEHEYNNVLFDGSFSRSKWRTQLDFSADEATEQKNIRILKESARWYLQRYDFYNGMRAILQFYSNRLLYIVFIALLSFIVIPTCLHLYNQDLLDNNLNDLIFADILYVLFGVIPFIVLASLILNKMFLPIAGALLPRLLMAIASAWLFFSTTEELVKASFDVKIFDTQKGWVLFLLIPVILFMVIAIKNVAQDISAKNLLKRMLLLLSIGFIYSVLIGMFFQNSINKTILVRSEYLKEFYKSEIQNNENIKLKVDSEPVLCGKDYPKSKTWLFHNLHNMSDKCIYEYLKYMIYKIEWLNNQSFRFRYEIPILRSEFSFEIIPGMLLYRAIFVLFLGIFVQLIFEDKPITEPL